jgi:hypothetical protein
VTKLKSRAVLEVLNAGYSVVWSDVDIAWFVHTFDALASYMSKDFVGMAIQSTIAFPHESVDSILYTDNSTGYRRLNSGLYVATYHPIVRTAFQEIVEDAKKRSSSEQPSFDRILC